MDDQRETEVPRSTTPPRLQLKPPPPAAPPPMSKACRLNPYACTHYDQQAAFALQLVRSGNLKWVHSPKCWWYTHDGNQCDCPVGVGKAMLNNKPEVFR